MWEHTGSNIINYTIEYQSIVLYCIILGAYLGALSQKTL
jgi:hypothetical protein